MGNKLLNNDDEVEDISSQFNELKLKRINSKSNFRSKLSIRKVSNHLFHAIQSFLQKDHLGYLYKYGPNGLKELIEKYYQKHLAQDIETGKWYFRSNPFSNKQGTLQLMSFDHPKNEYTELISTFFDIHSIVSSTWAENLPTLINVTSKTEQINIASDSLSEIIFCDHWEEYKFYGTKPGYICQPCRKYQRRYRKNIERYRRKDSGFRYWINTTKNSAITQSRNRLRLFDMDNFNVIITCLDSFTAQIEKILFGEIFYKLIPKMKN